MSREIHLNRDSSPGLLQTTAAVRDLLRRGEIVACAVDGKAGSSEGLRLPLMGHERQFRIALPLIATLTNAAVVPFFAAMKGDGRIEVLFDTPLPERRGGESPRAHAEEMVKSYVQRVQAFCEAEPGHIDAPRIVKGSGTRPVPGGKGPSRKSRAG